MTQKNLGRRSDKTFSHIFPKKLLTFFLINVENLWNFQKYTELADIIIVSNSDVDSFLSES